MTFVDVCTGFVWVSYGSIEYNKCGMEYFRLGTLDTLGCSHPDFLLLGIL